jgi:preprotein translocase subunit SecA
MRLFGSDRIAKLMDRLGHQDGEVIQHRMISNSIERAQKKVEENNFGIRKKLLEYDDVMNQQREVIYDRRKHALYGERLKLDIANSMVELVEAIVYDYHATKDFDGFNLELISSLHIESPISEDEFIKKQPKDIVEHIVEKAVANYQKRTEEMSKIVYPVVKRVHEDPKANYKTIAVPFTDGRKSLQVVADLEKSYNTEGTELVNALEKSVTLAMIDLNWKDHLREMDELRQSVQNAVYEQKDPLLIYKFESFELFKQIMQKVGREVISFLMKATLPQAEDAPVQEGNRVQEKQKQPELQTQKEELPSQSSGPQYHDPSQNKEQPKPQPAKSEKTYGRNDKVTVLNLTTGEEKEVKYKQAEPLLKGGQWRIKE